MTYIKYIIFIVLISFVGCSHNCQRQIKETSLPSVFEYDNTTVYIERERYLMLDYDFYICVPFINSRDYCLILFCEKISAEDNRDDDCDDYCFNDYDNYLYENAIMIDLSIAKDSIVNTFNECVKKMHSYIEKSPYFNQQCKIQNKINILKFVFREFIYYLEHPDRGYNYTYADNLIRRGVNLDCENVNGDIIDWTFVSSSTSNIYTLSLIKSGEFITVRKR